MSTTLMAGWQIGTVKSRNNDDGMGTVKPQPSFFILERGIVFVKEASLGIQNRHGNTKHQNGLLESPKAQFSPLKYLDSYSFQIIIDKSLRKLRNRRIPNGA